MAADNEAITLVYRESTHNILSVTCPYSMGSKLAKESRPTGNEIERRRSHVIKEDYRREDSNLLLTN